MKKKLEQTIQDLKTTFGEDSINYLGSTKGWSSIERNSSGSLQIDNITGGGYPKGRIIEIFGRESSGKSTLAMHAVAEIQRTGGTAAFIDMEHAFNREYAEVLGIDIDKLIFSQPDSGEEALDMAEALAKSGEVDIIIVDSVSLLLPQRENEVNMGDSVMGVQARLMSQAMRKLTPVVNKSKSSLIFINQTRDKIGVTWGSSETTSGGNALRFAASIRMKTQVTAQIKDGDEVIGVKVRISTPKNKTFPPFRKTEIDIIFGKGVDTLQEILDLAIVANVIKKSGSWYSYGDVKLGQGAINVKTLLNDNPELLEEIAAKVTEFLLTHEIL